MKNLSFLIVANKSEVVFESNRLLRLSLMYCAGVSLSLDPAAFNCAAELGR